MNSIAQEFGFQNLIFSSEGVQLKSRELPKYEKLVINVVGIQGFVPIENVANLAMEVRVSDENDKEIVFSPDMFNKQPIPIENIPYLDFSFGLGEGFEVGKTYFIKVRLWDRNSNKEMTKETSVKVLPRLINKHVKIEEKVLSSLDVKVYLNKNRYFEGNYVREGDELYFDMFFEDIRLDKKVSMDYSVNLIEVETGKKYPVESDVMVISDPEQLGNMNYGIKMEGSNLIPGKKYQMEIGFKIDAIEAFFKATYSFVFLGKGSSSNKELIAHKEFQLYLNKEEISGKPTLFPGDRLDLAIRNLNTQLEQENMINSIGAEWVIFDSKGKEITRSTDLFVGNSNVGSDKTSEITLNWASTWDIEENQSYLLKAVIWDKFSLKRFEFDINFKGGKFKKRPYGLEKNKNIKFFVDKNKIKPVATYVIRNGFPYDQNLLNPGDEVFLKVSGIKNEGVDTKDFKTIVQITDLNGKVLTENVEDSPNFTEGEIFSTITIPYSGEDIGKSFILVSKLMDGSKDVLKSEYTFKVVK